MRGGPRGECRGETATLAHEAKRITSLAALAPRTGQIGHAPGRHSDRTIAVDVRRGCPNGAPTLCRQV